MLKMRIVGLSDRNSSIILQTATKRQNWKQIVLPFAEFNQFMKLYFPKYYKFYEMAMEQQEAHCYAAEWFYNFGETRKMRIEGESFIFINSDYRIYTN